MVSKKIDVMAWMKILPLVDSMLISHIPRVVNITMAHTCNIVKELEEKGFVKKSVLGREVRVELTDKGKKAKRICNSMMRVVGK